MKIPRKSLGTGFQKTLHGFILPLLHVPDKCNPPLKRILLHKKQWRMLLTAVH